MVLVTPLYWYSISGQLKNVLDHYYAFDATGAEWHTKEGMLIACGASEGDAAYDGIVRAFENICGYKKWENRGVLLVKDVTGPDDIQKTDALHRAEEMGAGA